MKNKLLLILFCLPLFVLGQDLSGWTYEELNRCNTAKNEGYLTAEEKKVIQLINLVRLDGQKFYNNIAKAYLDSMPATTYTRSLPKDLKKANQFQLLDPKRELYDIAFKHAKSMGQSGKVGHDDFAKRIAHVRNKYYGVFENCDYGYQEALDIVMRLLIDEGVSSLGHRESLLNPEVYYIGTSIQPHKKWKYNCVQILSGKQIN